MPNHVIDTVHKMAIVSKQTGGVAFTEVKRNIITDDDEKTDFTET